MNLPPIQQHLREQRIDGWLLHDFRGSNLVLARLLGGKRWTTRRVELFIPVQGEPELLLHSIDASQFKDVALSRTIYRSWQELNSWLAARCGGRRIAVDFSPGGALPAMSYVDAGTVELLRGLGTEVVSSADLIQSAVAVWSAQALELHRHASREVTRIKDAAFAMIRSGIAAGAGVQEYAVQRFILDEFTRAGLHTADEPVVAVNSHSGDPHYAPTQSTSSLIKMGDWVLIDLWARAPGEENIFSDITWVGFCGSAQQVPDKHRKVFDVVKASRDAALDLARGAWKQRQPIQGWQLDDAARAPIIAAGFEQAIRHRTGHSLSAGPLVHGLGMNLDNLETHDTRQVLPGIGFTIEPGIYLPEFGVRLEINLYVDPKQGPEVTSCIQDEIVPLA